MHLHWLLRNSTGQHVMSDTVELENFGTGFDVLLKKCSFLTVGGMSAVIVWQTDNFVLLKFADLLDVTNYSINFGLLQFRSFFLLQFLQSITQFLEKFSASKIFPKFMMLIDRR